jgi:hypothetical protein
MENYTIQMENYTIQIKKIKYCSVWHAMIFSCISPIAKYFGTCFKIRIWIKVICKFNSKRRIISLRHSSILRRFWLNFMPLCLVFIRRLFQFSQFVFRISNFFDLSITEETWVVEMRIWLIKICNVLVLHLILNVSPKFQTFQNILTTFFAEVLQEIEVLKWPRCCLYCGSWEHPGTRTLIFEKSGSRPGVGNDCTGVQIAAARRHLCGRTGTCRYKNSFFRHAVLTLRYTCSCFIILFKINL